MRSIGAKTIIVFTAMVMACAEPPEPPRDDDDGTSGGGGCVEDEECQQVGYPKCVMGECVECASNSDCSSPTSPACIDNSCGCNNNNQCGEDQPYCTNGQCAKTCVQDDYEPNDSSMAATSLSLTDDLDDLWICPEEYDWFKFTIS